MQYACSYSNIRFLSYICMLILKHQYSQYILITQTQTSGFYHTYITCMRIHKDLQYIHTQTSGFPKAKPIALADFCMLKIQTCYLEFLFTVTVHVIQLFVPYSRLVKIPLI